MERVNMIATTALKYAGQKLSPGDHFTATRAHARAFNAIKRATYAPEVPPNAPEAPLQESDPDTVVYETSSMEAESAEAAEPVTTKRAYRTRQMKPKP